MIGNKPWRVFVGHSAMGMFPNGRQQIGHDVVAALALAAVAIPEQMATARLAGVPAVTGLFVFVAACLGFFLLGSNRSLSVGADSTIAPIFAGSLALLAVSGSSHYLALASALAIFVGVIVSLSGIFRIGWIARLLSVPVITGFLAGIAVHIAVSQLPALLGIASVHGDLFNAMANIGRNISHLNPVTLIIGVCVFAITLVCEKVDIRLPGALIATVAAALAVWLFKLNSVAVLGVIQSNGLRAQLPDVSNTDILNLLPIALIISLIVMIQTVATTRSFHKDSDASNVNRDLVGVGFANIISGFFGGFPANASPPRTAIVSESGGTSRFTGLCAAIIVTLFLTFGLDLLATIPIAALAGLLLFVAQRIFRFDTISSIARQAPAEFILLLVTAIAIIGTPIQTGVGIGIALSLLHGVWTITQTQVVAFKKVPGSTVWWPASSHFNGEVLPDIVVVGFQAPLFFLNAETFRRTLNESVQEAPKPVRAIVLEASSIVEVDFSGAQILVDLIRFWKDRGVEFYVARLESIRAQESFQKFGVLSLLGEQRTFHSVDDAIKHIRLA